jgi:uncharacterized cupin superfamily protein
MKGYGGRAAGRAVRIDEWFYVVEGEYVAQVGDERFTLSNGDSLLAPGAPRSGFSDVG